MRSKIDCCHGCVPPKKTPTCKFDGTCNKYAEAKEKYEKERLEDLRKRDIQAGLRSQVMDSMERAYKARRRKRRW